MEKRLIGKYMQRAFYTTLAVGTLWLGIGLAKEISAYTEKINRFKTEKINRFKNMNYQQAITEINTPQETEWYVRHYIISKKNDVAKSFKQIHETREGDCSEAVVAASALLSDNGYPPIYLSMRNSGKKVGHGVFLYQQDGKWGTIGINSLDNNTPKFNSLEEIARRLKYNEYKLTRIRDDIIPDWISTDRSLYLTEEEKSRIKQTPFKKVE